MSARYLVVPDTRRGHGTGHMTRAARLAASLDSGAELLIDFPWNEECHETRSVAEIAGRYGARIRQDARELLYDRPSSNEWTLVIIDAQKITRAAHAMLRTLAPTVGIDLGGEARLYASYLIDTLPNLFAHAPNLYDPGLNELPARLRPPEALAETCNGGSSPARENVRILVTLGGEDPAALTPRVLESLGRARSVADGSVDVVLGPMAAGNIEYENRTVSSVVRCSRLKDIVGNYDIVITTFGLTAYEALAAGCTVLTVAPGRYHRHLAARAGLYSLGGPRRIGGVDRAIRQWKEISHAQERLRPQPDRSLADVVRAIDSGGIGPCPIRGGFDYPAVTRTPERTYRKSMYPGLYYLERFAPLEIAYTERYFFEEYRKQYGRSYLEDFGHIRSMCEHRLDRIERLLSPSADASSLAGSGADPPPTTAPPAAPTSEQSVPKPFLVDLGCAYGPMLAAASARGYAVQGVEWFAGAVEYCNDSLGLPAVQGDVCDRSLPDRLGLSGCVDVVTMWYVIEHLRDLDALLDTVRSFLRPGGVFAFATPNASGASARVDFARFLGGGPADHWSIWSERHARRVLTQLGFSHTTTVVTGHHPERFAPKLARTTLGNRIVHRWSILRRLGDTFEAYAIRGES